MRPLPYYGPAPAPPAVRKSRWPAALAAIGVVGALAAAATVAVVVLDPFGSGEYPREWDARAAPFTRFVERTTGHTYDHPVPIRFLPAYEFEDLVAVDAESFDEETQTAVADTEAHARALGLFSGGTNLTEELNDLNTSGILAYYSPEDREIVVRLPKGVEEDEVKTADDLPLDVQVTLVHELTHVMQDQIYGLDKLTRAAVTDEESSALTGLIEGHASYVEDRYVSEALSSDEEDDLYEEREEAYAEFEEETATINPVISAVMGAPYAIGPAFVAALDDSGDSQAVDDAFADPPTTERELMQPGLYLEAVSPPEVQVGEPPEGAERIDSGTQGSTTLYLMLSLGLPANAALQAVDGVAADAYVAYRLKEKLCIDITIAAVDAEAADKLEWGLTAWANGRPAETEASATRDGDTFTVHACDPGPDANQTVPGSEAVDQLFGRSADLGYFVQHGWDLDQATCIANGLNYEYPHAQLLEFSAEVEDLYRQLDASCA